jgi:hypothetical protein
MKIPELVITYSVGLIVWIILFFVVGMSFQWSVVIGIIIGFITNLFETIFRGQE